MIDFRKVGEAADLAAARMDGVLVLDGKMTATGEARLEAIGRAAVAAMIPEPENFPHLGEYGHCNHSCPFRRHYEESGFACTIQLSVVTKEANSDMKCMKPGPSCPAQKGGGA